MPDVNGQVNAQRQAQAQQPIQVDQGQAQQPIQLDQRQAQQPLQADYRLIQEQLRNGAHSKALQMKLKEKEDEFFCQIVHDPKYKELGNLQNYINERNKKAWTQSFDECQNKSDKILTKFRKLYKKNAGKENWEESSQELAQLKADALALTETMTERDQAQKAIRDDATFAAFDAELQVMIQHSAKSDSSTYKAVVAAAREYLETEDLNEQLNIIWRMQACMKEYAKLRYKTKYGSTEGERRMTQVTKLLAMTDRFLEFQEVLDLKKQNNEFATITSHETKHEEAAEFEETRRRYDRITTRKFLDSRWNQICLPYKRDKDGNVTKETQENYNITMKFLRAFQSNNTRRQMAAIARIYLKQNLPDFTKEDLNEDNIFKIAKSMYGNNVQTTNKSILCDFINELGKRTRGYDVLLNYMGDRISDGSLGNMLTVMQLHMLNAGADLDRLKRNDKKRPGKAKVDTMLEQARAAYDTKHQALDPELENQLRQLIAEVDKEELAEKQKTSSPEYLKELCRFQTKKRKLYEDKAQTLIKERYSEQINGDNKYWEKKAHLGSLLLPYAVNKDGQVASKSEEFFKYNEKMIPLLHSEDPEDRIAALASVYLRLRKFNYARYLPTSSTIAEFDKQMLETPGFVSQYQAFGDFLAEEAKRSPDHPMIKYMKKVYENPLTTYSLSLVNTNRYAHGYDSAGTFINNADLEKQSQQNFKTTSQAATEELNKQREANNKVLDETEETKLKQLCESKGLKIFSK